VVRIVTTGLSRVKENEEGTNGYDKRARSQCERNADDPDHGSCAQRGTRTA
jgi:hypothetical protein